MVEVCSEPGRSCQRLCFGRQQVGIRSAFCMRRRAFTSNHQTPLHEKMYSNVVPFYDRGGRGILGRVDVFDVDTLAMGFSPRYIQQWAVTIVDVQASVDWQ